MKRKKFIRQLEKEGYVLLRHGSRHDVYQNPATEKSNRFRGTLKLMIS
jgi:predicted RNA binding protein YcfA (HicA-like mRNA interferase family)